MIRSEQGGKLTRIPRNRGFSSRVQLAERPGIAHRRENLEIRGRVLSAAEARQKQSTALPVTARPEKQSACFRVLVGAACRRGPASML